MEKHPDIELTDEMRLEIRGAIAEVDEVQLAINRRLTTAQRFAKGVSMSRAALDAAIYRLQADDPSLTRAAAQREALRLYYAANPSVYLPLE